MHIVNLAQKSILVVAFFVFGIIFTYLTNPQPVHAACAITFNKAMTTSSGSGTMVIFNSSISTTASKVGTVKIKGKSYDVVSVPNKPFAVAQVPKQDSFSVSWSDNNGNCTGVSTNSTPYNAAQDPYQAGTATNERWKVVTDNFGKKSCVIASDGNGAYISKLNCLAHGIGSSQMDVPCTPTCSIGGVLEFDTGDSGGSTVTTILTVSISIAAVVAFILAGFGAVKIVTSAGNPSGINSGREMIISAISGLLFIVFAVTILEIIGANILNLPGIEATSDIYAP